MRVQWLLFLLLIPGVSAHVSSAVQGDFGALMFESWDPPAVGIPVQLTIYLTDIRTGQPRQELDISHERLMHVFVVGEGLQDFSHIHVEDFPELNSPERYRNGMYTLEHTFASQGKYLVVIDYADEGKIALQSFPVYVVGPPHIPQEKFITYSTNVTVGDYEVGLGGEELFVNESTTLSFTLIHQGEEVRDLQQYLGSEIHLFIADENLTSVDHTHAYIPGHGIHSGIMPQRYVGPTVPVQYVFAAPGTYVLFAQFQHNNQTITSRFFVEVKEKPPFPWPILLVVAGVLLGLLALWQIGKIKK